MYCCAVCAVSIVTVAIFRATMTHMKKLFRFLTLVVFTAIPSLAAYAQVTADPAVEGASVQSEETVDFSDLKNQPIEVRRLVVATELKSILTKLNVLYDKTKIALDRLSANGINTAKAEDELALVADSLVKAKVSIDVFADTNNLFKPSPSQPTPLRDAVVKAETSLKISREHIINTLLLLKAAISADNN